MFFPYFVDYLTDQGYKDIIPLHSKPVKKKTQTEYAHINHGVICSKNGKYFRLLVEEVENQGHPREPFSISQSKEISQDEYDSYWERYHPSSYAQYKRKIVDGKRCPKCGGKMIFKTTRKGERFCSCVRYPDCKGSLDYHEPEKREARL